MNWNTILILSMVTNFSAIPIQGINILQIPFYVVVFIISGGVHHYRPEFKVPPYA